MTRSSSAQVVAERLTRYYLTALSVIAILSLGGLWLINNAIKFHESDSRVLNVSGRQRMLSQKLVKLTLVPASGLQDIDTLQFVQLLETWNENQRQLGSGLLKMDENYQVKKSRALTAKFNEIDPVFRSLSANFHRFIDPGIADADRRVVLKEILVQEPVFLDKMDEIVFQFDAESRRRVNDLRTIEYIMAAISLLTLLMEALLVFRPVVRYTRSIIQEVTESREALRLSNEKLQEANLNLLESQKEVLALQEVRHSQQRKEDQIRSAALMEGQEEERRRLARELHDGVGQMLTGLHLLIARLKKSPPGDSRLKERIEETAAYVQEIIRATRQVSHNVMPAALVDYGLGPALEALLEQMGASAASHLTLSREGEERRLLPAQEIGLYRIAQEALTNALKYSEAGLIRVRLLYSKAALVMEVTDDGRGFDTQKVWDWQNAGLENMQTRAKLLRADFSISSGADAGTCVRVTLGLD